MSDEEKDKQPTGEAEPETTPEPPPKPTESPDEAFTPVPVRPPPAVARVLSHLPDYDYDAVFCNRKTGVIIMVMSMALIGTAFVLFGRRLRA